MRKDKNRIKRLERELRNCLVMMIRAQNGRADAKDLSIAIESVGHVLSLSYIKK